MATVDETVFSDEKEVVEGFEFPDTPAGRGAEWFFKWMDLQGEGLTPEEVSEHMYFSGAWKPEESVNRFKQSKSRGEGWRLSNPQSPTPFRFEFDEIDPSQRRWLVTFDVEEASPHRIIDCQWKLDLGGAVVREATAEDSAELAHLERDTPMIVGDSRIIYDRGDDFWALTRLMEENVCLVAEEEGEIMALHCAAFHRVRIGGVEYGGMLGHHSRIPTKNQKRGFFSALNNQAFEHYNEKYGAWWSPPPQGYGAYAYTAVDNTAALRLGGPGSWSIGPIRALLDCRALAREEHFRWATPEDAPRIVEIINTCHNSEEMFLPLTVESLESRLGRAPDLYSWGNFLMGEGAVLGVWASGLRIVTENADERRESIRASTLDFGFAPDSEDEFERLIRSYCRRLVEQGSTELSILTSEASPGYEVLKSLAHQLDPFVFRMTIPEPQGSKERGLYVDAIYF